METNKTTAKPTYYAKRSTHGLIAFTYHTEMEEGHVGPECATIEEALSGHTDGENPVKALADWQPAENNASEGCETATLTWHDRPCGILVRTPVKAEGRA